MILEKYHEYRGEIWIIFICLIAFFLRTYGINYQSLWLDELHTMNEADPSLSWGSMFKYLQTGDRHPPLFFVVEKMSFIIFGHTAFVARMICAIAGTAGVWAMYLLGKEIMSKRLGIICSILTAFNFFEIYYSREARPYIFAFLFATLSFTFFTRLIKYPAIKNAVLYSAYTVLLLYSHYYGIYILIAQAFLTLIFSVLKTGEDRKPLFKKFTLSLAIIFLCYLPVIFLLSEARQVRSSWIKETSSSILQDYFYEYFGNSALLSPLIILLLVLFFVKLSYNSGTTAAKTDHENVEIFNPVIILSWVFIGFLRPHCRNRN